MTAATKNLPTTSRTLAYSDKAARQVEALLDARETPEAAAAEDPWAGALCSETDPELFFPEKGESPTQGKRLCQGCPLISQCLEAALKNDERFGVWGGMTPRERRQLKRNQAEGDTAPDELPQAA